MKKVWVVIQHCDDYDVIGVYDNIYAAQIAVDINPDERWFEEKDVLEHAGVESGRD